MQEKLVVKTKEIEKLTTSLQFLIGILLGMWIIGILVFLSGANLVLLFESKLRGTKLTYYIYEDFSEIKNIANYNTFMLISLFITSIFLYLILKKLIFRFKILGKTKKYYYSKLNLFNNCLTVCVVFFGFLPLFLSLVKIDQDIMSDININILVFSVGFFIPYISLLIEIIFDTIKKEIKDSVSIDQSILNTESSEEREVFFSKGIKQKHLSMLVDSKKLLKYLDKKNIYKNIDNDLTELYLNDVKKNFSIQEIKIMKKTLESDVTTSFSQQTFFVSIISILIVLITTIFSNVVSTAGKLEKNDILITIIVIIICYIGFITFYYFYKQTFNERKIKLVNHLNLIIADKDSSN